MVSGLRIARGAGALLATAVVLAFVAGCSGGGQQTAAGGGVPWQAGSQRQNLEVPPDLTQVRVRDAYQIPGETARVTTSTPALRGGGANATVLPEVPDMRIERDGGERWLVVEASPEDLWERVRGFWLSQGFLMERVDPALGVMETGWAEEYESLPVGRVREALERFKRFGYRYGVRDRFRTRFERPAESGGGQDRTTLIYVTHRGAHEVVRGSGYAWEPRATDPELEAEMLTRLMLDLGFGGEPSDAMVAAAGGDGTGAAAPGAGAAGDAASQTPADGGGPRAEIMEGPDGVKYIRLQDDFDRAWRRASNALDRAGFTVEDRDRSQGLFFVRYVNPDREEKRGWWSRLTSGNNEEEESTDFRILLEKEQGEGAGTRIVVRDEQGAEATGATADRILTVLEQTLA